MKNIFTALFVFCLFFFIEKSVFALNGEYIPGETNKSAGQQYFCHLLFTNLNGLTAETTGILFGDNGNILMVSLDPPPKEANVSFNDGTLCLASLIGYDQYIGLYLYKTNPIKSGGLQFSKNSHHKIFLRRVQIITPYEVAEAEVIGPEGTASGMGFMLDHGIGEGSIVSYQEEFYGITGLPDSTGEISHGIPYSLIKPLIDNAESEVRIEKPYLGIMMLNSQNKVSVVKVAKNSSAHKARIKALDIIKTINDEPITSSGAVQAIVKAHKVGDKLNVMLKRETKEINLIVTLEAYTERTN